MFYQNGMEIEGLSFEVEFKENLYCRVTKKYDFYNYKGFDYKTIINEVKKDVRKTLKGFSDVTITLECIDADMKRYYHRRYILKNEGSNEISYRHMTEDKERNGCFKSEEKNYDYEDKNMLITKFVNNIKEDIETVNLVEPK